MKHLKNGRTLVIASFAVFWIGLMCGWTWWDKQTPQAQNYLLGRTAYITTMYDAAVDYFDHSYADYLDEVSAKQDFFTAPASLEMAELSQHFKALSLIKMGNSKLAVISFKEALKLTDERSLSQLKLSPDLHTKLLADRKITQIDFEILFHQKPQLAKGEGKGKGKGDDGEKQSEDPSNNAGKMDRDKL